MAPRSATAHPLHAHCATHSHCTHAAHIWHGHHTHCTRTAQHECAPPRLLRSQERLAPRFRPEGGLAYRNERPLLPNASQVTVIASARSRFAFVDVYRYDPAADKATKHVCELLSTCITTQPERHSEQGAATEIQRIMRGRTLKRQLTRGSGQLPAAAPEAAAAATATAATAAAAAAPQRRAPWGEHLELAREAGGEDSRSAEAESRRAEAGEEARRRWEHAEALWKRGGDKVRDQLVQVAEQQALIQGDPLEAVARGIKMAIRANLMTLAAMFREIDEDASGCISVAEFERALRNLGLEHTHVEVKALFAHMGVREGEELQYARLKHFLLSNAKFTHETKQARRASERSHGEWSRGE